MDAYFDKWIYDICTISKFVMETIVKEMKSRWTDFSTDRTD